MHVLNMFFNFHDFLFFRLAPLFSLCFMLEGMRERERERYHCTRKRRRMLFDLHYALLNESKNEKLKAIKMKCEC